MVFEVHIPFKLIKSCSIKLIKSSDPHCSIPSSLLLTTSSLRLKSKINGLPVFSAGVFTLCSQTHHSISEQMQLQQEQQLQPAFFLPPPPTNPALPTTPPSPTVGGGRVPLPPSPILTPPPIVGGRTPTLQSNPARIPASPPLAFSFPPFPFPFFPPFPYNPQFPGAPPAPRAKDTNP